MNYADVEKLVDRSRKERHQHNGGFTLFGWAFNFGIYKTTLAYRPIHKLWWN